MLEIAYKISSWFADLRTESIIKKYMLQRTCMVYLHKFILHKCISEKFSPGVWK